VFDDRVHEIAAARGQAVHSMVLVIQLLVIHEERGRARSDGSGHLPVRGGSGAIAVGSQDAQEKVPEEDELKCGGER
jgi:hypothetical protein